MRRKLLLFAGAATVLLSLVLFNSFRSEEREGEEGEENESLALQDKFAQQFEQLKDPALGTVPMDRLVKANEYTKDAKARAALNRTAALSWQERGPIFDVVGPSNGNIRGGAGGYTAGIVETALVDLANDPTGNTVFVGSPSGGLWRCTNFAGTTAPNWAPVNDFQANLAIVSICQNPASPNIMYLATGDGNTRDVRGYGIWKSTNAGLTWTLLPSTTTFTTAFKILCDASGNVYLAGAGTVGGVGGLKRSNDGGNTWVNITPTGLTSSNPGYVTDLEISSTGRLHAVFGYYGTKVQHAYTDAPSFVSSAAGWNFSTGIRNSGATCTRIELATQGNTLYAVTSNASWNIDSCYKSVDGGATWTLQNTAAAYTSGLGSGQVWYAVTLQINPDNPSEFIVGGLDAYRSTNEGVTVSRITYWVTQAPYVHADHHFMQWYKVGASSRVLVGCDGGITQSTDGGVSWTDRNQNLGIKQFYSCAISPTAGVNYLLAGAQDNGVHQLIQAGLGSSTEVTGGDGAYVHINQQNPQIQFGTYVYNQYRRSVNGGANWSAVNLSSSSGYFINPFDYDDAQNIMYASNANTSTPNNQIRRWNDANTTSVSTVLAVNEIARSGNGNATSFKVSPYTANRVFIGTSRGGLLRLENANTVATSTDITANITDITGSGFTLGAYLNCINTGTSDNNLVATFTNYGINNVWVSSDGGASWTAVDGNLPDMPVWWAVFVPGSNNTKMIIATETGVYTTDALNGSGTVWMAEPTFPIVRTTMLKIRASDNTLVASTYGRGLWTASLNGCSLATISTQPASQTVCPTSSVTFSVTAAGTGLTYQWRKGGVNISGATSASYTIASAAAADAGSYDVVITNSCGTVTSSAAVLTVSSAASISTQPTNQTGCPGGSVTFNVTASGSGLTYQWRKGGTAISGATGASYTITGLTAANAGTYDVVVSSSCGSPVTSSSVTLTVGTATAIGTQPASQTVCAGTSVTFTSTATGSGTLTYQWRKGGTNISGATSANYTISSPAVSDAGSYDVVVTGTCGSVTSSAATLTVNATTAISTQPASQASCLGTAASFSVTASGSGLGYQWRKNGTAISGATSATYTIPSLVVADAGNYDVVVTGSCGTVTSSQAVLTVNTGGGCVTAIPNVDPDVSTLLLMPSAVRQNTVLRLKVQRPMNVNWSVVDAQGKVVMTFTQKLSTGQTDLTLHFERLAAGVYYLNGNTEKGKLGTVRFEKL